LGYISVAESIGVSSTTFTQSAPKANEFGEITLPLGLLRHSRSSKVTEFLREKISRKSAFAKWGGHANPRAVYGLIDGSGKL